MPSPLTQVAGYDPLNTRLSGETRRAASRYGTGAQLFQTPLPLALWHLASFDAPTVAVVWSLAFAWLADVRLPLWAPLLLALMAWSVYIGDRLLDALAGLRHPELHPLRERHHFHWRHRFVLLSLAMLALLAALRIIVVNLPHRALTPDSLLGAAAFAYFSGVHSRRKLPRLVTKEFLVGVIFTSGCMLPAWLRLRSAGLDSLRLADFFVPVIYFAALAWLNCHAIAQWESDRVRIRCTVTELGAALAAAGLLLAAVLAADTRAALLLAAASAGALLLAMLDRARGRLTPLALRAAADFVLLTPISIILLARLLR